VFRTIRNLPEGLTDQPHLLTERSRLVANDVSQTSSTAVALFQKAHGRMTTMQRIDEQIHALIDQRRKLQEELRAVQALINEEFDRVVQTSAPEPGRMLTMTTSSESSRDNGRENGRNNGHARDNGHSQEYAEAVA